jgi:CRP/FNR family transcriptional regulator
LSCPAGSTGYGRRQILSFLLPGEIVSASLVFNPVSQNSLEAVTDVRHRLFSRPGILTAMKRDPKLLTPLSMLWAEENVRADQLVVDLGQRSADERIAGMILDLAERLRLCGQLHDGTMEFPLRQHHIADATGLTTVHAGKLLNELRRAGLIELNDRCLTLSKLEDVRRVAGLS